MPQATWADVGNPAFLSAAKTADGSYALCGITSQGEVAFALPLPSRGHAAAAHPLRPEAVAIARRPGTFALVIDCVNGRELTRLNAPTGRHFYGHGAFSTDGALLFTTENDFDAARGVVGVWDASNGYVRVGEFASGGVGPHEILVLPDGETLVVANGGIETHPDTGRAKLNLPTMRSNLTYVNFGGELIEQIELKVAHQRNSIRHIAVAKDTVAFAMQWQGDMVEDFPLLGVHNRRTGALTFAEAASVRAMTGYLGSVAISRDGARIAVTSPRSGLVQIFDNAVISSQIPLEDVCGVAALGTEFVTTTGRGTVAEIGGLTRQHPLAWDNHLIAIREI